MKTSIKGLVIFALAVVLLSPASNVLAAEVYKFSGYSASAYFYATDSTGCIVTGGTVFVFENISHSPQGPGTSSEDVLIDFFQYDQCTNTTLLSASNSAPAENVDFHVDGDLDSATLTAIVPMFDNVTGTAFDFTVNLSWTGTSARDHQSSHYKVNFQGCHVNLKNDSSFRYAEAAGTITDGTTNFTPLPSSQGTIFLAKGGEISHGCG